MTLATRAGVGGAVVLALTLATLGLWWLRRRGPHLPPRALPRAGALGLLLSLGALLVERWTLGLTGNAPGDTVPLYIALGLWGPLGEGLKLLALWPSFRQRELRGPLEALTAATLVASLFALVSGAASLATLPPSPWAALGGVVMMVPLQVLLTSPWAFVLGRSYRRSNPRAGFLPAWLASVVLNGVSYHLLSRRTGGALLTLVPLLLGLLLLAYLGRDSLKPGEATLPLRRSRVVPTFTDIRERLVRRSAPVSLRWVLVGAMVNQGMLLVTLAGAVFLGNYMGVDFASIDATSNASLGPIVFLVIAALLSFPLAGFLVARASGVPTLLEPALASVLSQVGVAVMLGVAAPIALAVLIATAPVALALGCAGAWVGMR